jgi:phenylacetate-coenzyme A ligase PaaK-like adenylate-forming protein
MSQSTLEHSSGRPAGDGAHEFVREMMGWHFNPETGSPFWLRRAASLDFDPRTDVTGFEDLGRFPNVANELRDVRVEELIPKGYGPDPDVVGVFESGGTTGAPKRVVLMRDWCDGAIAASVAHMERQGLPRNRNWLALGPTGPHMAGELMTRQAAALGGLKFAIDMDPRWVKKLIAAGRLDEAEAYADHLLEQAAFVLQTQDVGVLLTTPPMLERLARRDDLVELVGRNVAAILWGGAHMDADTRHLLRTDVFPGIKLYGSYGSTMALSAAKERLGLSDDDPCVFDPASPFVTFSVIDPETGARVPYGERGQIVVNHISRGFLLPNNLERDTAIRMEGPAGQIGDSVADVTPVLRFEDGDVIEGVY